MTKIIVADASPLIALGQTPVFENPEPLKILLLAPDTVLNECRIPGKPSGNVIEKAVNTGFIKPIADKPENHPLITNLQNVLDKGEAQAIAAAMELNTCIMIDEKKGRKIASNKGLKVIGSLTLLLQARKHRIVGPLKPIVEQLRERGIRYSDPVINELLALEAKLITG
ncbi:DUF3368 domain-containing protein [Endozoicomonas gorgoniicola]|uniref:DUF3368 domain-containing protein n=1 Tax=Endozoicomonas gorgoniicola TaxID=1234144 RepID=A0ABT3MW32_9GAMM|nr:DUF3368 domain-containing protein [Endozoicomonas gorgoniicola]MCW7553214.1 DUF3368 domain-containing protein [Endozoicomonas gorgoniicola]